MNLLASTEEGTGPAERGRSGWLAMLAAFGTFPAFLLSVGVVAAATLGDSELVTTRAGLRSVDLGWPLIWVHQDQTSMDPPLPYRMGLSSPWEHATALSGRALLVDVLIVFTGVVAISLFLGAFVATLVRCSRAT